MAKQWLVERFDSFFTALAVCPTEEAVKHVCEAELSAWRVERKLADNSLRVPITDTRKEIRARLQLPLQTWALAHMNLSEEQWATVNKPHNQARDTRLENQSLISNPDGIVEKAVSLLESSRWADVATGLLALTGRRLTEVLKTGVFTLHTGYSVMFAGQLKTRSESFPAFEIPTLCGAQTVIDGVARLRSLKSFSEVEIEKVALNHEKTVAESCRRHFADLIPSPASRKQLTPHAFRAVYTRIAVLYYCPVGVNDLHFLATTQGHFAINADGDVQREYSSEMSYNHYKLVDSDGQIDGRQGVKLGLDGVQVLGCFAGESARATRLVAPKKAIAEDAVNAIKEGVKLMPEMFVSDDMATRIYALIGPTGDFDAFLKRALEKETKFMEGVATRHAGKDFAAMSSEELKKVKHPDALNERTRRAIAAIAEYNDNAVSQNDRWFINTTSVANLTGGRFAIVSEYVKEHQLEIDELNAKYNLDARYNRKPTAIEDCITIE